MSGVPSSPAASPASFSAAPKMFGRYLDASRACLERGDYDGCFQSLDLALSLLLREPELQTEQLAHFFSYFSPFQATLLDAGAIGSIRAQILPCQEGLLQRLVKPALQDVAIAQLVIQVLEEGCTQIGDLVLKKDYLENAYKLAMGHALLAHQLRIAPEIGDLHLQLGMESEVKALSSEVLVGCEQRKAPLCFTEHFLIAACWYNVSLELSPGDAMLQKKVSDVEGAYLRKLNALRDLDEWAKDSIWSGRSPERVDSVACVADLMIEYGLEEVASKIYYHCANYAGKMPFPGSGRSKPAS